MPVALIGIMFLTVFLCVHVWNDLSLPQEAWYFHSTPVWLGVMAVASGIYLRELGRLKRTGVDVVALFKNLPPE